MISGQSINEEGFRAHGSAIIDQPCSIGKGTRIWHWVHIMKHVHIGEDCMLGDGVFVGEGSVLGNQVRVQNYAQLHTVVIDKGVFVGPGVVFTNVKHPRAGKLQKRLVTWVREGATIGANAVILPGLTIGKYAMVGAGAVVTHNVPAYTVVVGNPAHQVGLVSDMGFNVPPVIEAHQAGTCAHRWATSDEFDGWKCERCGATLRQEIKGNGSLGRLFE
jgi:UDP-2-acetamido-3-amino-2,3-dideoxy-glucuronate N-acetyltransferase